MTSTLCLFAVGFDGGCGREPTEPLPEADCRDLSDSECVASPWCELVEVVNGGVPTPGAPDSPGSGRAGGPDIAPADPPLTEWLCIPKREETCQDLNESQCIQDPNCEPEYAYLACLQAPEEDAPIPCRPEPVFAGCNDKPVECGPVCEIYCPYGNVLDASGCPTCECNPSPEGCAELDEYTCIEHPECQPVYGDQGNCTCGPCEPGQDCPCSCSGGGSMGGSDDFRAPPVEPPYPGPFLYCEEIPSHPCDGLNEAICIATPGCRPYYGYNGDDPDGRYPCKCDPNDPVCDCVRPPPPPEEVFAYCGPDFVPGCTGDLDCPNGYCELGATCAGLDCPPPPPSQCVYPNCDDGSALLCDALPPPCATGEVLSVVGGCWACLDARTCGPQTGSECQADQDCPHGYCEHYSTCTAIGCPPPPPPQCVYPNCDDGSELYCLIARPRCDDHEVPAVRNGCWACVDARSCQ